MEEITRQESEASQPEVARSAMAPELKKYLDNVFVYHKPQANQPERYEAIRSYAKDFAYLIAQACPESRERSLSFTKLQECVMFANAAIAINE